MKHFMVEIEYLVPVEQLGDILPEHRAFLKTGYEKGDYHAMKECAFYTTPPPDKRNARAPSSHGVEYGFVTERREPR